MQGLAMDRDNLPLVPHEGREEAYHTGFRQFTEGKSVSECPYKDETNSRKTWLDGWYTARTGAKLGSLFERWGIEWP